ncbi:unnamed protein product, partial [Meganyctiphanes norvegica]
MLLIYLIISWHMLSHLVNCVKYTEHTPRDEIRCPNALDILPCVCVSNSDPALFMDCSLVSDTEELINVFQATFPYSEFEVLHIMYNFSLTTLPTGVFGNVTFSTVLMNHGNLQTVEEGVFRSSLPRLKHFTLSYNLITTVPHDLLSKSDELVNLYLNNNKIVHLPIIESQSLQYVDFSANPISELKVNSFDQMPNLKDVLMVDTSISELPVGTFIKNSGLQSIYLNGNNISQLNTGCLNLSTSDLLLLDLSHNHIRKLQPAAI